MSLVIGLTGGIASGKSTVSEMFNEFNIQVVDADKIAREVVYPGEEAYGKIVDTFGKDLLLKDKTLDRKKLGSIIFANEEKRKQLNSIVHPAIRKEMLIRRDVLVESGKKCIVLDIPLLFESKLLSYVDKTVVVYVDEEVQLTRLMDRDGYTLEEAKQRINAQMPLVEKAKLADAIINNNGTKKESYKQLEQLLNKWM